MKLPYRWIWRNRIGYMNYGHIGTIVFVVQFVRCWRMRRLGNHYGPFKTLEFKTYSGCFHHLNIGKFQFSVMPLDKTLWRYF
jgi:hypothetical protein